MRTPAFKFMPDGISWAKKYHAGRQNSLGQPVSGFPEQARDRYINPSDQRSIRAYHVSLESKEGSVSLESKEGIPREYTC
jgi:hypothetical protein